ncbi:MAG TPA: TPM domain-containing protein [Novosphingobium sp.]|nr:TPM domain-containing protein [Novosphingobium sp.]HQA17855.1 TPM domain-containing protein [Novosphingobium sp.]
MLGRAGLLPRFAHRALTLVVSALLALALLLVPALAKAQTFPQLTGPVVDQADVIPPDVEARLTQKLTALKTQSQRELTVVTLSSLEGYDIADYGYQLGRHWGLGNKERNDGAILIIAPNERKLRIEVGYGLEPVLTDGLSSLIINRQIVPKFKAGDMPGGIEAGTDAIIQQLTLPPEEAAKVAAAAKSQPASEGIPFGMIVWLILFFLFFVLPIIRRAGRGRRYRGSGLGPVIVWDVINAANHASRNSGGWGSGGGSWGGGWGGGGGSFGGGGASGSW